MTIETNPNLIEIHNETIEILAEFTLCEQVSNHLILPLLKRVETSKWDHTTDQLLTVALDGADISNRSQVHCEISRIPIQEARKIANLLDDHVDDIDVVIKFLKGKKHASEMSEALTKQIEVGGRLAANIKEAIYQYTSEAMETGTRYAGVS